MPFILTLDKLKEYTPVYNGFARIQDCNIPDYYKEVFPKKCVCGAEMIMTEPGHTQLQCCNPGCWVKMGHRLAYFISKLGYKGFGLQSALTLVEEGKGFFKYPTFLSAFLMSDTEVNQCLTDHLTELFAEIREDIRTRPVDFVDAIASLGIPNIGKRSTFFDVVKSPVVLLNYVLKDKTEELCEAAGIQAISTRFQLAESKLDIITLMTDVMPNIINTPKGEVFVAITGKVSVRGRQYTRAEFIELCESLQDSSGTPLYKIVETKSEAKLQHVIADIPSSSDKYNIGKSLGILITADEFYNKLESSAKEQESENKEEEESSDG